MKLVGRQHATALAAALGCLLAAPLAVGQTTFVPFGATWSYLDDGSDQGSAWVQPAFDDSGWASGPAELGYGERDEATVVGFGPVSSNKFATTYLRHTFTVANPAIVPGLKFDLLCDDGAIIYINGTEVWRTNVPASGVTFQTYAVDSLGGASETDLQPFVVGPEVLVAGDNVLAVQWHQAGPGNSDLSFNVRITDAIGPTPPSIQNCQLSLSPEEPTITITSEDISATDLSSNVETLRFTVSGLESGRFELTSNPGSPITTFLQSQITAGAVRFAYQPASFGAATSAGTIGDPFGRQELSGLVASIRNPDLLWAIEDSDNPAALLAMGSDGSDRGDWTLAGAINHDWEDVAAATINGQPFIYAGDFGDNEAVRNNLVIYRVKEPLVTGTAGGVIQAADIEAISIRYPESPSGESGVGSVGVPARRDAEGLIVDPTNGDMYVFSKREPRCRIFRLPHQPAYTGIQTLEYIGEMPAVIADTRRGFTTSETAVDISRDGLEIVIRNYERMYLFRRPDLGTPLASLLTGNVAEELPLVEFGDYPSGEPQGEGLCFSASGDGLYTLGENLNNSAVPPLFFYRRLPPLAPPAFSITVSDGALTDGPHAATIHFGDGPLEIWRQTHFTQAELDNPAMESTLWGDLADPNFNGRPNLIEYAVGSDPRASNDDGEVVAVGEETIANERFLTATYQRDLAKTDIDVRIQASSDLLNWDDVSDTLMETAEGIETRRAIVSTESHARRWVRLTVSPVE